MSGKDRRPRKREVGGSARSFKADNDVVSDSLTKSKGSKVIVAGATAMVRTDKVMLGTLHNIPLEILFEIAGILDPVALLHLSRTCRTLQTLFYSPEAYWIWKHVLLSENCGWDIVFDLISPFDVHIVAIVSLIYDRRCFYCGSSKSIDSIHHFERRCKDFNRKKSTCTGLSGFDLNADLPTGDELHPMTIKLSSLMAPKGLGHLERLRLNDKLMALDPNSRSSADNFHDRVPNKDAKSKKEKQINFEKFVATRSKIVTGRRKLKPYLNNLDSGAWEVVQNRHQAALEVVRLRKEAIYNRRANEIRRRCLLLGINDRDLLARGVYEMMWPCMEPAILTDVEWERIKPLIVERVQNSREMRALMGKD